MAADEDALRVVAWNIAHGRGSVGGWRANWRGGDTGERDERLEDIAAVLEDLQPDILVLNEVDVEASWSGGVSHARDLAQRLDVPHGLDQLNFDVAVFGRRFRFGNAVLSRWPFESAAAIRLPVTSRWERTLVGAKAAARVDLEPTPVGPVVLVPIHLDPRSRSTRLATLEVLDRIREKEDRPLILAGDFNSTRGHWPGGDGEGTIIDELLARGFSAGNLEGEEEIRRRATYPAVEPTRAIDWVLVEPPLEITELRTVPIGDLSDHAPVVAEVRMRSAPPGELDEPAGPEAADVPETARR